MLSVVVNILLQIIEIDIYGELYLLGNIQSFQDDSDQVFAMFPFGIECSIRGCFDAIMTCADQGEDILSCARYFVEENNWQVRPAGSALEHSINTCNVQAVPYDAQPMYNTFIAAQATLPIPYDLQLQTRYQVPPDTATGPRTGFDQDTSDEDAERSYDDETKVYKCREDSSAGSGGHVCPPATEFPSTGLHDNETNTNVGGRLPPALGLRADNPSITLDGTDPAPPEEIIPYWRWEFDQVVTGLPDPDRTDDNPGHYNLIFAGLKTTQATYDAMRAEEDRRNEGDSSVPALPALPAGVALPEIPLGAKFRILPNCSNTRAFPGETAPPGDGFWYWHGEENERKASSPISIATAFALGYLDYSHTAANTLGTVRTLDFLHIPYNPKVPNFPINETGWGLIFGAISAGINAAHPSGNSYDVCESGFIALCGVLKAAEELGYEEFTNPAGDSANRDDSGIHIAHKRKIGGEHFFPMPEIDIAFAQSLYHDPIDPALCAETAGGVLPQPATFSMITGGADENPPGDSGLGNGLPGGFKTSSAATQKSGEENAKMSVIVRRNGDFAKISTVDYRTLDGTATSGSDYIATSGSLTFLVGEVEKRIEVEILDDELLEDPEYLTVELYNSSEPFLADKNFIHGLIYDDESEPQFVVLEIDDAEVVEGDEFNTKMRFPVRRLSGSRKRDVKLCYATLNHPTLLPATAEDNVDFEKPTGSCAGYAGYAEFTLRGGVSEDTIDIDVYGDYLDEDDENINLYVFRQPGDDLVLFENPEEDLELPEQLQTGSEYVNEDGSMAVNENGSLAITNVSSSQANQILSNIPTFATTGALLNGEIIDNDELFDFVVSDATVNEGDEGQVDAVFTITRTGAADKTIPYTFRTVNGSASGGVDFDAIAAGQGSLAPGQLSAEVIVKVNGDLADEADETFSVEVGYPESDVAVESPFDKASGSGVISNDDGPSIIRIEDIGTAEGNSGETTMTFVVSRTGVGIKQAITLNYTVRDFTARASDNDYESTGSGQLQLAANEAQSAVEVTVLGDIKVEEDETFSVTLSLASEGDVEFEKATAIGTIYTDDFATPPVAAPDSASTSEDQTIWIDVLANDSDVNGDQLTLIRVSAAQIGSATISGGRIYYAPFANNNGTDSFQYSVQDSSGLESNGLVTVNVSSVNDVPVARNDYVSIQEDGSTNVDVASNDTDADGDTLVISEISAAENGTASFAGGSTTYIPNANYFGTESITYTITDGQGGSSSAILTINIASVNDIPVAQDDAASTAEDQHVDIRIFDNDSDADGDSLRLWRIEQPTNGTLAWGPNYESLRYTPKANTNGTDTFRYQLEDYRGGVSEWATVTIVVAAVNDAPNAVNDSAATNEDSSVVVQALSNDSDADGDTLIITGTSLPANGVATISGTSVTYQPNPNFHGSDSFTYNISDGNGGSDTATIYITVRSINDSPLAAPDAASTNEDTTVFIDVLANDNDPDGDPLTISNVGQGAKGSVAVVNGQIRYVPHANVNGSDTFGYTIRDTSGKTSTTSVVVTIVSTNDRPVAVGDYTSTSEDTPVVISVTANDYDADGDTLTVQSAGASSGGTVTVSGNAITFTPNANYVGTATFTYVVADPGGLTSSATVTVKVNGVNDAPVASPDIASTPEDTGKTIYVLSNDTDADGNPLSVTQVTQGQNGTVTRYSNRVYYRPTFNFSGADTFTYTVSDGQGGQATGSVTVNVTAVNDAPRAYNDSAITTEGQAVSIAVTANDNDAENDVLVVQSTSNPARGSTTIVGNVITYTPDANTAGYDSFTYVVSDGNGGTASATVSVSVIAKPATVTVTGGQIVEGNSGHKSLRFTVQRSGGMSGTVGFRYQTISKTASAGSDFVAVSNVYSTIGRGVSTRYVYISVNGDTAVEDNETFDLRIYSVSGATATNDRAEGVIVNDDVAPQKAELTIHPAQVVEGNSGTKYMTFTVTRSGNTSSYVSAGYSTSAETAREYSDYYRASGTLSFSSGVVSRTFSVRIIGDTTLEQNETFLGRISAGANSVAVVGSAKGVIVNDDSPAPPPPPYVAPVLGISGGSVIEGDSGSKFLPFTITRTGNTSRTTQVNYYTSNGSAYYGSDYERTIGTATFYGSQTSTTVNVRVYGDTRVESNETVTMRLNAPVNGTIGTSSATGTIVDNDTNVPSSEFRVIGSSQVEGDGGYPNLSFVVTRSGNTTSAGYVYLSTSNGSASTSDYVPVSNKFVYFSARVSQVTVNVRIRPDNFQESNETVRAYISSPVGGSIATSYATGTIIDDDTSVPVPPVATSILSVSGGAIVEGDSGTKSLAFTIRRTGATNTSVSAYYSTQNGSAYGTSSTSSSNYYDYRHTSGQVSFSSGSSTRTVYVPIFGDTKVENNEYFYLNLRSPSSGATIGGSTSTGVITDDDGGASSVDATDTSAGVCATPATAKNQLRAPSTDGDGNFDICWSDSSNRGGDDPNGWGYRFNQCHDEIKYWDILVNNTLHKRVTSGYDGDPNGPTANTRSWSTQVTGLPKGYHRIRVQPVIQSVSAEVTHAVRVCRTYSNSTYNGYAMTKYVRVQ